MYLLIVEVSQKQAYIFKSLRLRDNIRNSDNIAKATSKKYFEKKISGYTSENMVYSGGGHTVLQFETKESAVKFAQELTSKARIDFEGMEIFAKIMEYNNDLSPAENIENLCKELERKKSLRKSAFRKIDFGIDTILETTSNKVQNEDEYKYKGKKFKLAKDLKDLGGSKNDSDFIAVVHIDGNSMGDRVKNVREKYGKKGVNWNKFKDTLNKFSESIDSQFKEAFYDMVNVVIENILSGNLIKLDVLDSIPIRKLILAGDDVCFVCDGRIGLECAYTFMKKLNQKSNQVDGEKYYAAAGVCIVHSKFPFYRAYNISESLCSSAKKLLADTATTGCAIDWHIDFGEPDDNSREIKKRFIANDGTNMLLRPYFMCCDVKDMRKYEYFREFISDIINKSSKEFEARGKIKEMRNVIHEGESASNRYIKFNKIRGILVNSMTNYDIFKSSQANDLTSFQIEKGIYTEIESNNENSKDKTNNRRCVVFDAIESMDTFIKLEGV